jgi:hypothetical protein
MIQLVTCVFVLLNNGQRDVQEIQGDLVSDSTETWMVDITAFIKSHPEYKDNNLVQLVDSNMCLLTGRKNA